MTKATSGNTRRLPALPGRISLIVLSLLGSQIAFAAEPGWYAGASVGEAQADVDVQSPGAVALSNGFTGLSLNKDEDDTAYKIFGGYQFSDYFALEGGYFDLGDYRYNVNALTPGATWTGRAKVRGLNLDLVGILPMGERFSAFGRVGAVYAENKNTYRGYGAATVASFGDDDNDSTHKYGVGLQYRINDNMSARLEAERYEIEDAFFDRDRIDVYSLGLVYRFGNAAPEPVRTPVSAAPAPAPTPPPAPAPTPEPVRVTLSADSLFAFDSDALNASGRAELDKLITDLRGVDFDTIRVTGYTDRIGTQAYNMDLSARRANAVKNYLVSASNIAANRITTRALNGSDPVTSEAQCSRNLPRAELIACLAPDRRVEVEVNGSRPR